MGGGAGIRKVESNYSQLVNKAIKNQHRKVELRYRKKHELGKCVGKGLSSHIST